VAIYKITPEALKALLEVMSGLEEAVPWQPGDDGMVNLELSEPVASLVDRLVAANPNTTISAAILRGARRYKARRTS
jgi:hypothetical protein